MTANTPEIQTERLIMRKFVTNDVPAFDRIISDEEVNRFLPVFPFQSLGEAERYLNKIYIESYERPIGFRYAICLKSANEPIGYVNVSDGPSYDLGYGLRREFWRRGIATEACRAVVAKLAEAGIPYITATHDVNNPKSGGVMKRIGMTYCYSYEELWQPKNIPVIFRLYQLNLDGQTDRVFKGYWDQYPRHIIERNV